MSIPVPDLIWRPTAVSATSETDGWVSIQATMEPAVSRVDTMSHGAMAPFELDTTTS